MNSTVIEKSGREKNGKPDFTTVTEFPGGRASREQLAMLSTRYRFAADFCGNKQVLEVGCGAGLGLGYLARFAKKITGVDIDDSNLETARTHYRGREKIELRPMDAQELAFDDESFDILILFEAIYYLERPGRFLAESRRVLRPDGTLLINTVNPEWQDFNPSPFSYRYLSARELSGLLQSHGFQAQLYGAFPALGSSWNARGLSFLKRTARDWGLIPRTMKGKEFLKRIFFGKLSRLPPELVDAEAENISPVAICPAGPVPQYKVLYAAARKSAPQPAAGPRGRLS